MKRAEQIGGEDEGAGHDRDRDQVARTRACDLPRHMLDAGGKRRLVEQDRRPPVAHHGAAEAPGPPAKRTRTLWPSFGGAASRARKSAVSPAANHALGGAAIQW